ncbi:MAG: hypothetical protein R3E39_17425 [Anaerolineae bacterium]
MTYRLAAIVVLIAVCGMGCSSINGEQETLAAENAMLSTQIVEIRATATIVMDRLARTAEYIETAVARAENRRGELAATLQATGVDPTRIAQVSPNPAIAALPTTNPQLGQPVNGSAATPGFSSTPANITIPTPTPGQPTLYSIVTAEGVGNNDCALASVNTFSINAERIYVVATASNITAGTMLGAQWYQGDVLAASQDFTPDFDINDNCIWFYVDQTDFVFTAGNYGVQLTVSGAPSGPRTNFTITG